MKRDERVVFVVKVVKVVRVVMVAIVVGVVVRYVKGLYQKTTNG